MVRWRLKELAEARLWNQHSLAMEARLSYNTVRPIWQNTAKRADLDTLDKLSRILQVAPGDLIERIPDPISDAHLDEAAHALLGTVPIERTPIQRWARQAATTLSWPVEVLVQRLAHYEEPLRAAGLRLAQSSRRGTLALVGEDGQQHHYSHIWRES